MSTYFREGDSKLSTEPKSAFSKIADYYTAFNNRIQLYKTERWLIVGALFIFFLIRLVKTGGNIFLNKASTLWLTV